MRYHHIVWTSLKEYLPRVARAWLYALVVGGVGGGVGLVLDVLPGFDMPLWAWALVVVLALGTAQFRAMMGGISVPHSSGPHTAIGSAQL